ncbi:hypothetical protein BT67DRAFT_484681 [Trichocladium antarcticum]|uniref:Uncharacterized protein n=1 Tax=Trichocladium antarcticum TaxID=1450529 RepID=A0AAN6ZBG1_9PEZI|nr:hypothetical protein BT67DRAFT_484681 [Trichocladium antarcticum]
MSPCCDGFCWGRYHCRNGPPVGSCPNASVHVGGLCGQCTVQERFIRPVDNNLDAGNETVSAPGSCGLSDVSSSESAPEPPVEGPGQDGSGNPTLHNCQITNMYCVTGNAIFPRPIPRSERPTFTSGMTRAHSLRSPTVSRTVVYPPGSLRPAASSYTPNYRQQTGTARNAVPRNSPLPARLAPRPASPSPLILPSPLSRPTQTATSGPPPPSTIPHIVNYGPRMSLPPTNFSWPRPQPTLGTLCPPCPPTGLRRSECLLATPGPHAHSQCRGGDTISDPGLSPSDSSTAASETAEEADLRRRLAAIQARRQAPWDEAEQQEALARAYASRARHAALDLLHARAAVPAANRGPGFWPRTATRGAAADQDGDYAAREIARLSEVGVWGRAAEWAPGIRWECVAERPRVCVLVREVGWAGIGKPQVLPGLRVVVCSTAEGVCSLQLDQLRMG